MKISAAVISSSAYNGRIILQLICLAVKANYTAIIWVKSHVIRLSLK
uniref:Uncharacterized protein n=1 Tax=Anguilla anguilla TaxID=7936 RepID=A0A0E9T0T9_ANGAN